MLTQDWMMRQIETLALAIAKMVFQKDSPEYAASGEQGDGLTEADRLHIALNALVREGKFNDAENRLFAALEEGGRDGLEVAVDFYYRLNNLTDQELAAGGFTRQEVEEGLHDVMDQFGIVLL